MEKKVKISQSAKRAILKYVNDVNTSMLNTPDIFNELLENPHLRPNVPVVLYRGIRFRDPSTEKDFKDGYLQLEATDDLFSSWTYKESTAMRFARFRPNVSKTSNIMNMFAASTRGESLIDGTYGVVIKHVFQPEDILVDIRMIPNKMVFDFTDEGEVLVIQDNKNNRFKIDKIITKDAIYDNVSDFMKRPEWLLDFIKYIDEIAPVINTLLNKCEIAYKFFSSIDLKDYSNKHFTEYPEFKVFVEANELLKKFTKHEFKYNDVSYLYRYTKEDLYLINFRLSMLSRVEPTDFKRVDIRYTNYYYKNEFKFLKNKTDDEMEIFKENHTLLGNNMFSVKDNMKTIISNYKELKDILSSIV